MFIEVIVSSFIKGFYVYCQKDHFAFVTKTNYCHSIVLILILKNCFNHIRSDQGNMVFDDKASYHPWQQTCNICVVSAFYVMCIYSREFSWKLNEWIASYVFCNRVYIDPRFWDAAYCILVQPYFATAVLISQCFGYILGR